MSHSRKFFGVPYFLLPLILISALVSCAETQGQAPYIVSGPVSACTGNPGYYEYAGIEFVLFNSSNKDMTSADVSCLVYSASGGKNPLSLSNRVQARFTDVIPAQTGKRLAISLDGRLSAVPSGPFLIDFFTIPKIVFSDGSSWEDRNCNFYTRSY